MLYLLIISILIIAILLFSYNTIKLLISLEKRKNVSFKIGFGKFIIDIEM